MPTINVVKQIADSLEVLAAELQKISSDPYWQRFAEPVAFEEFPKPEQPKADTQTTPTAPAVTLEELRHLLTKLTNEGKREKVKEILTNIGGCKKLSEVAPEKYEAIYNAAKGA